MVGFEDLGLKKEIVVLLKKQGFSVPYDVQKKMVPLMLQKKNIIFTSPTGTGKTLAYLAGFLSRLNPKLGPQMLILSPTRELSIQIGKVAKKLCDPLGLKVGVLYGGRDLKGDYRTVSRKNQIIVATPGRLVDHINLKTIKAGEIRFLIYDEADHMFDDGFYKDCSYIKSRVSKNAQIVMTSATITKKVTQFAETIDDMHFLEIGSLIPENIIQEKYYCKRQEKNYVLLDVLKKRRFKRAIIFCNTKMKARNVARFLSGYYDARSLTGGNDQKERDNLIGMFRAGRIKVLVTTDIAARGLDIPGVGVVVNYDVPHNEFYVHRIGRTGREGRKGYALTLVCPEDEARFEDIEFDFQVDVKDITPAGSD